MTDHVINYNPIADTSDYASVVEMFTSIMKNVETAIPVRVTSVNASGLSPVGVLDAQPMVTQVMADNTSVPLSALTNLPYFRLQGGTNAVIIDPQVGDIGIAIFASRDISSVKRAKTVTPPSSLRMHSMSDGMYVGGILNGTPSQYIWFKQDGILMFSPSKVTIQAPEVVMDTPLVTVHGRMEMTGSKGSGASTTGGISNTGGTIESNGITLETHVHRGVTSGGSNTGTPV